MKNTPLPVSVTRFDVVALGELLVDFTQTGMSEQGNPLFEANPGGAPANVLAMLRKLGKKCAFIGKVGSDRFGETLSRTLAETGIDIRALSLDPEIPTTLAVVHNYSNGERDFSFYRKPGADIRLSEADLDCSLLQNCRIFHFGSLSLTDEPSRSATRQAVQLAKTAGALISFDPNLRPSLWPDGASARAEIAWGLGQCDILKIADNELEFMTGEKDFRHGAEILKHRHPNIRVLNVTAGSGGSYSMTGTHWIYEPAWKLGGVIDTTGAGDTFCACVLNEILECGIDNLDEAALHRMLRYANTAAWIVTTRKGAIRSMPDAEEVKAILQES